jgi:hypothetical protein
VQRDQPFAARMLGGDKRQLGQDHPFLAQCEAVGHQVLDRHQPLLFQIGAQPLP